VKAYIAWLRESPLHWGPFVTGLLGLILSLIGVSLALASML
jgi:hypothetical protein